MKLIRKTNDIKVYFYNLDKLDLFLQLKEN